MLTKPPNVKKKIWEQHVTWMNVMREGSLNEKEPKGASKKNNAHHKSDANALSGKSSSFGMNGDK